MDQLASLKNGLKSPNLDLLRQDVSPSIIDSLKEFSWEEKFEWMHQKKLKGNRLFNKRKYSDAAENYKDALMATNIECEANEELRIRTEIIVPCLLGIACCLKQWKDYEKGIELCNKAIELNKQNPMSYLRRGHIYQALREYEKAMADFSTATSLGADEQILAMIKDSLDYIQNTPSKQRKAKREDETKRSPQQKILKHQEDSEEEEEEEEESDDDEQITIPGSLEHIEEEANEKGTKILKYNDDLEELNRFGVLKYAVYPIKMSLKFMRERTMWCRRRKNNYEMVYTESIYP